MSPSEQPVHLLLVEDRAGTIPGEGEPHTEQFANRSAAIVSYDSARGVCNELARIALNRSAVMQAYDSMCSRSGFRRELAPGAPREPSRAGWFHRALDRMFGPSPR
jgi:hypothetical protein